MRKPCPASLEARCLTLVLLGLSLLISAALVPAAAQSATQARGATARAGPIAVDANEQLFATMCALYAAGFEPEGSSAADVPALVRLRAELVRMDGPATRALRSYYREHLLASPAATLSRYISFTLVAGPPPKFQYTLPHDDLPPDVLAIEDFGEVLANFYQESQLHAAWMQLQPEYAREIAQLQNPVTQIVMTSTGYLREILRPASRRTFAVYVEPLVGAKTNFRNYGDRYAIVLSPGRERAPAEIRHAFLHFLLDPLALRYPGAVVGKQPLLSIAARAPRLANEYKEDLPSFFTECLVRAVELRLQPLSPEKLSFAMDDAQAEGYVLVPALVRALSKFESAEPAISYYFPDLADAIDVAAEVKRLQNVRFAEAAPAAGDDTHPSEAASLERTEVKRWLDEGDRRIAAQDAAGAAANYQRVLERSPDHPRALYGLAVAAVLQGNGERAHELFQRVIALPAGASSAARDPKILAWSHIYMGRLHDFSGERELALNEYRAALAVEGAPETAKMAAQRGIDKGYLPPRERDPSQKEK